MLDAALTSIDSMPDGDQREAIDQLRQQQELIGRAYRQIGQLKGRVLGGPEIDLPSYVRELKMVKRVSARDATVAWVAEANLDIWERGATTTARSGPENSLQRDVSRASLESSRRLQRSTSRMRSLPALQVAALPTGAHRTVLADISNKTGRQKKCGKVR